MHQLAILNPASSESVSSAATRTAGSQRSTHPLMQVSESNGEKVSSGGFAPMLGEHMQEAKQLGIDLSDPEALQAFLGEQGMLDLQSVFQDLGLDLQQLTTMNGQELAAQLEQAGISLPSQSDWMRQWDQAESLAQRLSALVSIVKPESAAASSAASAAVSMAMANGAAGSSAARGPGQYQQGKLNEWTMAPAPLQGVGLDVQSQSSNGLDSGWLVNEEMRLQSSVSPAHGQTGMTALQAQSAEGEGADGMWSYTGLTQAQSAVSGAQGNNAALNPQGQAMDAALMASNETDGLFKAQLDLATGDHNLEGADELLIDKPQSVSRLTELQAKQTAVLPKTYTTGVNIPVADPQWGDEMSQKIVWMTGRQIQAAEIHLNPAELGPVEVKISVTNDQATVTFNAQHATVREMLEANVQRLREMMESNGVDLSDVHVDTGAQEQGYAAEQGAQGSGQGMAGDGDETDAENSDTELVAKAVSDRLVDYYA